MTAPAIQVTHLTKRFKHVSIFENISFALLPQQIYGFIGHNGSGKSVLFKMICGFLAPDSGTIHVFGQQIGKDADFPAHTGVIIETPGFLEHHSAFQNLKYLAAIRNVMSEADIKDVLRTVELDPDSKQAVKKFSLGMKQRLALAQAIMEHPKLLILDEPFNGLDKDGVDKMRALLLELKQQGTTILVTSHHREDINILCDSVYEINHKQLQSL